MFSQNRAGYTGLGDFSGSKLEPPIAPEVVGWNAIYESTASAGRKWGRAGRTQTLTVMETCHRDTMIIGICGVQDEGAQWWQPQGMVFADTADRIIGQDAAQAVMSFRAGLRTTYSGL